MSLLLWNISSRSHVTTDGHSVSMSSCGAHSATREQILPSVWRLLSESCCVVSVGRPLWPEVRSVSCQSKSHYNWRSVTQYVEVSSPLCNSWPDITFCLKVAVLSMWGALSDERSGLLSFEVEVTLQLTVSQSVCQGVERTLQLVTRYYLLSETCCLVSVGRPLWREVGFVSCHSKSKSHYNDGQSVSMSRCRAHSTTRD
jgi:hypothetical protein